MNQIWTNPSALRSQVITTGIKSSLIECLKLSRVNPDTKQEAELIIFPNVEYNFTYFDDKTGEVCTAIGLVEKVYSDQIKIKIKQSQIKTDSKDNYERYSCHRSGSHKNCVIDSNNPKYTGPTTLFIPIVNIASVSCICNTIDKKDNKEGLYIMLMGISATVVTAVIVRLAFFDDCREEAIKYVNLEVGGVYDIAYEGNDGRIYENRAKVMQIEDNRNNFHSRPRRDYVRETRKEHVGFNNAIYIDQTRNKDEFMTGVPVRDIEIIVDTSEFFTGCYESISLSAIRDVTLVEEDEVESCREY